MSNSLYKPTIGLEIHSELNTKTKMFCGCINNSQELEPNKNICAICTGQPGTLPKINEEAVKIVIKTGLALNCKINKFSKFDRKNYFYPDLPKAFQISQYDLPLCYEGYMRLPKLKKNIRITRIHLEEDTAKLTHALDGKSSLVNFNRAGVPLMELVTEPDFSSADEVVEFAHEFQLILKYLGASYADMEKGQLRIEVNISVSKDNNLGTKVEIKNLNSFRSVLRATEFEIKRQIKALESGEKIIQETRGWDEIKQKTVSQRAKESSHDYRYFPEPDLPPMEFDDEYIEKIKSEIVELPQEKRERFMSEYNISRNDSVELVSNIEYADFFENSVSELLNMGGNNINLLLNYLSSDVKGIESDTGILLGESKLKPEYFAYLIFLLEKNKISSRAAKDVLKEIYLNEKSPEQIIKEKNLFQVSNSDEIEKIIKDVINKNKDVWSQYINGKDSVVQFLIGQVMKITKGRANPKIVKNLFEKNKNK